MVLAQCILKAEIGGLILRLFDVGRRHGRLFLIIFVIWYKYKHISLDNGIGNLHF